jgi:hypothetical protein
VNRFSASAFYTAVLVMAEPVIVGRNPFIALGIGSGLLAPRKLGGAIKGLRSTRYALQSSVTWRALQVASWEIERRSVGLSPRC